MKLHRVMVHTDEDYGDAGQAFIHRTKRAAQRQYREELDNWEREGRQYLNPSIDEIELERPTSIHGWLELAELLHPSGAVEYVRTKRE